MQNYENGADISIGGHDFQSVMDSAIHHVATSRRFDLAPSQALIGSGSAFVKISPDYTDYCLPEDGAASIAAAGIIRNSVGVVAIIPHPFQIEFAKRAGNTLYWINPETTDHAVNLAALSTHELWQLFVEQPSRQPVSLHGLKYIEAISGVEDYGHERRPVAFEYLNGHDNVTHELALIIKRHGLHHYYDDTYDGQSIRWAQGAHLQPFGSQTELTMHSKTFFKEMSAALGIQTPTSLSFEPRETIDFESLKELLRNAPCGIRVKSNYGISSHGQLIVTTEEELNEHDQEIVELVKKGGIAEENIDTLRRSNGEILSVCHRVQIKGSDIVTTEIADQRYTPQGIFSGSSTTSYMTPEIVELTTRYAQYMRDVHGYQGDYSVDYIFDADGKPLALEHSPRVGGLDYTAGYVENALRTRNGAQPVAYAGKDRPLVHALYQESSVERAARQGQLDHLPDYAYLHRLSRHNIMWNGIDYGILPIQDSIIAIAPTIHEADDMLEFAQELHKSVFG
ncbi:hypothetical protein HY469_01435 [Candidatus Roizmanbacteria bacterium]|nr:hypothetical protein [Candidatus Roizmanbacteria bacterium]